MTRLQTLMLNTVTEAADIAGEAAIIAFAEGRHKDGAHWLSRQIYWSVRRVELCAQFGIEANPAQPIAA